MGVASASWSLAGHRLKKKDLAPWVTWAACVTWAPFAAWAPCAAWAHGPHGEPREAHVIRFVLKLFFKHAKQVGDLTLF